VGSLCALGGTAPNPVFTALKYFREEFVEHVVDKKCRAGICTALVTYAIDARSVHRLRACARVCPTGPSPEKERGPRDRPSNYASSAARATRSAASTL